MNNLQKALSDLKWINHRIGDIYLMDGEEWKISYYPLLGTYKANKWIDFEEPRALIEKPIPGGIDFREVPLRYITKKGDK